MDEKEASLLSFRVSLPRNKFLLLGIPLKSHFFSKSGGFLSKSGLF
jgi:hypothetical protein